MTTLGKTLVFLNLLLAGLFLGSAVAVYAFRLNWFSYTPDGGEKVVGVIEELQGRIKKMVAARDVAEQRYRLAANELRANDTLVTERRKFYQDVLAAARTGKDTEGKAVKPAVQEFTYAGGLIEPKLSGKATQVEGRDADALDDYLKEIANAQAGIKEQQAENVRLVAEQQKLTAEVNGGAKDAEGNTVAKGVRQLLNEQREFARLLRDEQEHLEPKLANGWAEAQLLLKRNANLSDRRGELKPGGAKPEL